MNGWLALAMCCSRVKTSFDSGPGPPDRHPCFTLVDTVDTVCSDVVSVRAPIAVGIDEGECRATCRSVGSSHGRSFRHGYTDDEGRGVAEISTHITMVYLGMNACMFGQQYHGWSGEGSPGTNGAFLAVEAVLLY